MPYLNTVPHNTHKKEVEQIAKVLKSASTPARTLKRTVGHSTRYHKDSPSFSGTRIDITNLHNIVDINTHEKWVLVEPLVTMEELVSYTLPYGYIPCIVPEFKHITVGGAIQGLASESTAHRYGFFHEPKNTLGYEIILSNGEIVWVENGGDKYKDIQEALPGSYGTIGIITLAKIKLIKASPFIKLTYQRELLQSFHADKKREQFYDAVLFDKNKLITMTGEFIDEVPYKSKHYSPSLFGKWFDQHIQGKTDGEVEYFKTTDYLFRWDRGAFFIASSKFGNNILKRLLFGPLTSSHHLYRARNKRARNTKRIIQDIVVPPKQIGNFINNLYTLLKIESDQLLWILPMNISQSIVFGPSRGIWINIGIYHRSAAHSAREFEALNTKLEELTALCGGYKWLYAENFYTASNFWKIYNKEKYKTTREKYNAQNIFEDIYDKISMN